MARYCPMKDGPALYPECMECDEKWCDAFFCLVVGSRSFHDYPLMVSKLDTLLSRQTRIVIVSGGAKGADTLAVRYAREKGFPSKIFPADWKAYGKSAGFIRNREMHAYLAKQEKRGVVAFWDGVSKGTKHSFALAKDYKNPLRVIRTKGEDDG